MWAGRGDDLRWTKELELAHADEDDTHRFTYQGFGRKLFKSKTTTAAYIAQGGQCMEADEELKAALQSQRRVFTQEEVDRWQVQMNQYIKVGEQLFVPTCLDARADGRASTQPQLPGGMGRCVDEQCEKDSHNPNKQGGDPMKVCKRSHTHWDAKLEPSEAAVADAVQQTYAPYGPLYMFAVVQVLRQWMHINRKVPAPSLIRSGQELEVARTLLKTKFESACQPQHQASVQCYLSTDLWANEVWQAERQSVNPEWDKLCEVNA